ncbi:methyltransferase [Pseudomonas massiliensis]|uniref:methyltransferase n=1 Tax=Pseudomonas massiliensis TaxID=522492 RepID=UPI00058FF946|nr:methyltransferase [Pseudomonas massiliensis]
MLEADALAFRFAELGEFLRQHQGLWRPKPFTSLTLPWEAEHPELSQWLRGRSLEEAEAAALVPIDPLPPGGFAHWAAEAARLSDPGDLPSRTPPPAAPRLNRDVPGRKWAQVEAFAAHLAFVEPVEHWLDWCGGKGHLGRRLLQPHQQLTCLEFDPTLVDAGQALSDHHRLPAHHRRQDVMATDTRLAPEETPVALHACGDLHVRLLRLAVAHGCRQLAIAPCCYNRTGDEGYQPLSRQGQALDLALDKDDLGLPANEAVTAGTRERRQRDLSMARRLGFDLLQRHLRGVDEYLPTPSLPSHWLAESFADYCRHLARCKSLALGEAIAWQVWEAQGWSRLAQVRNLERVRNLFRRPLELWLVLDRALYLVERGYQVRMGTFCEREVTPRNLLMLAEKV